MPDVSDRLVIEGVFDPRGIQQGVDAAAIALQKFSSQIKQASPVAHPPLCGFRINSPSN